MNSQDPPAGQIDPGPNVFVELARLLGLGESALVRQVMAVGAILVLAWVGLRAVRFVVRRIQKKASAHETLTGEEQIQRTQTWTELAYSVARAVIWVTAALLILDLFFPIGPLLAGVGVFGLALSFGAQSLVKDFISGFFVLAENQFTLGDTVSIEGTTGTIEKMTLRVVMFRDVEGVLHIVPYGTISKVSNLTSGWARAVLDVGVAYREDVDRVIEVLRDMCVALWEDDEWSVHLTKEPEVLGVQDLADSSVNVRLVAHTRPGKQWLVKRELRRRTKNRFDEEGIEIPFPQRTLHIREQPATGE